MMYNWLRYVWIHQVANICLDQKNRKDSNGVHILKPSKMEDSWIVSDI